MTDLKQRVVKQLQENQVQTLAILKAIRTMEEKVEKLNRKVDTWLNEQDAGEPLRTKTEWDKLWNEKEALEQAIKEMDKLWLEEQEVK